MNVGPTPTGVIQGAFLVYGLEWNMGDPVAPQ